MAYARITPLCIDLELAVHTDRLVQPAITEWQI